MLYVTVYKSQLRLVKVNANNYEVWLTTTLAKGRHLIDIFEISEMLFSSTFASTCKTPNGV